MHGEFADRSKEVDKTFAPPFGIHLKVVAGKIAYALFLEDSLMTASSVQTDGGAVYESLGDEVKLTA